MTSKGICVDMENFQVHLDPKKEINNGLTFVSHAHKDHLHNQKSLVLTTKPTSEIARIRGYQIENFVEEFKDFYMIDSGHIFGSRSLLFGDDILYTGDLCTRERGFLKPARIPKCKTLITECTFGRPEFVFPSIEETVKKVNEIVSEMYSKGVPVILLGYELGKAQTLSNLFGHWEPLFYHDSVKKINEVHRKFKIDLKDAMGHTEAEKKGLLEKKPWLMIAPLMSNRTTFVNYMKSKYNAVTIGFTGWAVSNKVSFAKQFDYSIGLSDHCDYNELVELVRKTSPDKIFTIHGFVEEFAKDLTSLGFDAQPLREGSLEDFF